MDDQAVGASLAAKLRALDLTGDERQMLDSVVRIAAGDDEDEVAGFEMMTPGGMAPSLRMFYDPRHDPNVGPLESSGPPTS